VRVWEHEPAEVVAARVAALLRSREAGGRTSALEAACADRWAVGRGPAGTDACARAPSRAAQWGRDERRC